MSVLRNIFSNKIYCNNNIYKKIFFNGLFSIEFKMLDYCVFYKIFNLSFMERRFKRGVSLFKLFNTIKFKTSEKSTLEFLKPILIEYVKNQTLQKNFSLIHFITRLGETYLQMYHLEEYLNNNKIKNPIFISQFSNLKYICNMFYPKIKFITIPQVFFEMCFSTELKNYKHAGCYYFLPINRTHLINVEKQLNNNNQILFYDELKKSLKIKKSNLINYPILSVNVKTKSDNIIKQLRLKKRFAYIIPDAQSNSSMSLNFWNKLCKTLNVDYNYDIFLNTLPQGFQNKYKHHHISIEQAKYIASKADIIIGIRCGLLDIVTNNSSDIFAIYLPFNNRAPEFPYLSAEKVMGAFSLKQLPNICNKHLYEYNAEIYSERYILNEILSLISKKEVEH